jgi:hypothetical protein
VKAPVDQLERLIDPDLLGVFAGVLLLAIGLVLIFLALGFITKNMRLLVAGTVERAMNQVVGRGGGAVGILVGMAVTFAVQSSTITTSILVPLVAAGILTLPNAYPITLGANVGTTITALLASLAVLRPEGLTIALVHTLFNLTALALLYPIPTDPADYPSERRNGSPDRPSQHRTVVVAYVLGLFLCSLRSVSCFSTDRCPMILGLSRRDDGARLERIEATFQRMFTDDRHAFDLAMSALVGGASPGPSVTTSERPTRRSTRPNARSAANWWSTPASTVASTPPRSWSTCRSSRTSNASATTPRTSTTSPPTASCSTKAT